MSLGFVATTVPMLASTASRHNAARPLRVLCLHGYCQNAAVFRSKTGCVRRAVAKRLSGIEIVFVDAPHVVEADENGAEKRAWWTLRNEGTEYEGFVETAAHLRRVVAEQGAFDSVMGFSQGAVLAHLVAALGLAGNNVRSAILVSGFPSRAERHERIVTGPPLKMPSLHVWGMADELVPPAASKQLSTMFDSNAGRYIYTHNKGHVFPFDSAGIDAIVGFLDKQHAVLHTTVHDRTSKVAGEL
jgi:pimeloyl-ACP methyl ester carboxylesterase